MNKDTSTIIRSNVVCREAFASLHGIGTKRVRRVATCVAEGHTPKEQRGRHNNKRCVSDDLRNMVDTHMRSFPFRVSHYAGHGNKRRYLSSELCITKMYTLLLQASYPDHYLLVQGGLTQKRLNVKSDSGSIMIILEQTSIIPCLMLKSKQNDSQLRGTV